CPPPPAHEWCDLVASGSHQLCAAAAQIPRLPAEPAHRVLICAAQQLASFLSGLRCEEERDDGTYPHANQKAGHDDGSIARFSFYIVSISLVIVHCFPLLRLTCFAAISCALAGSGLCVVADRNYTTLSATLFFGTASGDALLATRAAPAF